MELLNQKKVKLNSLKEGTIALFSALNAVSLKLKGKTNWNEVDSLTDEQIEDAAKEDDDSALPTDEELKEFKSMNIIPD